MRNQELKTRRISRWHAASIHLVLSALIAALVFAGIYFLWYPGALFGAAGGLTLFFLIEGVDVALGPLITLIIFRQGKKGLRFDLATIAVLQLFALSYGTWVLFESRPAWIVFVKDRFELVRANDVLPKEQAKAKPPYNEAPITGPSVVGALLPEDPKERSRVAMSALSGVDVQDYPQYYVRYPEVARTAATKAKPLAQLHRFNPGADSAIAALPTRFGRAPAQLEFLPMRAGRADLTVIVDGTSGEFLGTVDLRPWSY